MGELHLFDVNSNRHVDALYAMLVATDRTQFFPEMYEIFGREAVIKFLDIFAGQTIRIPSRELVERYVRDVSLWAEVQRCERGLRDIAGSYGVTIHEIQQACNKVDVALRKLGIVVIGGGG